MFVRQKSSRAFFLRLAGCDVKDCAICTHDLEEGEDASTLQCKHQFHLNCVKEWFKKKAICPVCRANAKF
ncbi:hypothetical protein FGO68_gene11953 [Halteria grandinella]|uniref:RING-type E3 ubiquitin transferase n=1 Tax=Halteria grandinella TaxID=5974 RepID=A0A8J8NLP9_HALGN|nr:hypothetical protein FGO68_gene11953 [Halteria grandinella]